MSPARSPTSAPPCPERALSAEEEKLVNAVGTDPTFTLPTMIYTWSLKGISPAETAVRCLLSGKPIPKSTFDYSYLLTTNYTKTPRRDTVTGAKNTNGNGISAEPSLTHGLKPNYVPPPAYTVKGPELATDWEKANRPANITAGAAPLGKVEDILEERGRRYGPFKDHAMICQDLILSIEFWIKYKNKVLADDQKQALNVICDKIARIINGDENYVDNWDDIAGYATLVSKRLTEDAR